MGLGCWRGSCRGCTYRWSAGRSVLRRLLWWAVLLRESLLCGSVLRAGRLILLRAHRWRRVLRRLSILSRSLRARWQCRRELLRAQVQVLRSAERNVSWKRRTPSSLPMSKDPKQKPRRKPGFHFDTRLRLFAEFARREVAATDRLRQDTRSNCTRVTGLGWGRLLHANEASIGPLPQGPQLGRACSRSAPRDGPQAPSHTR